MDRKQTFILEMDDAPQWHGKVYWVQGEQRLLFDDADQLIRMLVQLSGQSSRTGQAA